MSNPNDNNVLPASFMVPSNGAGGGIPTTPNVINSNNPFLQQSPSANGASAPPDLGDRPPPFNPDLLVSSNDNSSLASYPALNYPASKNPFIPQPTHQQPQPYLYPREPPAQPQQPYPSRPQPQAQQAPPSFFTTDATLPPVNVRRTPDRPKSSKRTVDPSVPQPTEEDQLIRAWFASVDQIHSGTIDSNDLGVALGASGDGFTTDCVMRLMAMFDRNQDGKIDYHGECVLLVS
jgi:hypothetical protein